MFVSICIIYNYDVIASSLDLPCHSDIAFLPVSVAGGKCNTRRIGFDPNPIMPTILRVSMLNNDTECQRYRGI